MDTAEPKTPAALDVLCVGHACADFTFSVAHHPGPDEKLSASSLLLCGGGPAANAAVTAAKLGGRAGFCGYLGMDILGALHADELARENVDLSLLVRGGCPTPAAAVLVGPDGRRSVVNYSLETPPLPASDFHASAVQPRCLLLDGHQPELSAAALEAAQYKAVPAVLDAGSVRPGTVHLLSMVQYAVCSEKFALEKTGSTEPVPALRLLSQEVSSIVITLGERGLIWLHEHRAGRLEAFDVEAVDTTGAGDVFHGAFSLAVARGWDWMETLLFASAAAALSCTKRGGRTSIPHAAEVNRFLSSQPRPAGEELSL